MTITDLGGHSGCQILLCEDLDKVFVRKISSSIEYNSRLEIQADKQKSYFSKFIKTPKVYYTGYTDNGLFYFDMEYIQGITLAEYIEKIEIGKIRNLVEQLVESFATFDQQEYVDTTSFMVKIKSLKESLYEKENKTINNALSILEKHNWSAFTQSFCHGDMTLENLIIQNDKIYLIDFLDSFYDSWILDMGTLLQDTLVMWHYRYQDNVNINTILRLLVFKDVLIECMVKKMGNRYIEIYYALLLKLIRIFPYTRDDMTYDFLTRKTQEILDRILKEEQYADINSALCKQTKISE